MGQITFWPGFAEHGAAEVQQLPGVAEMFDPGRGMKETHHHRPVTQCKPQFLFACF